jgi:hypothetical protein
MKFFRVIVVSAMVLTLCLPLAAEGAAREAKISKLDGSAQVRFEGEQKWVPAAEGMVLKQGDAIKTASGATALLVVDEGVNPAYVEIKEDSQLIILRLTKDEEKGSDITLMDLTIGEIMVDVEKLTPDSTFEVKTPESIAGVRGTKYSVRVESF